MRQLTQTVTACAENGWTGNCWQTAIACLLDIDPETMPSQAEYDLQRRLDDGRFEDVTPRKNYSTALGAYLRKHHGLAYLELHMPTEAVASAVQIREPGWHMLTGRTVRSAGMGGMRHVVVARHGEMVWDPHPSRAGLLDEIRWAFLVPFPKAWEPFYDSPCVCPSCAVDDAPTQGQS